MILLWGVPDEDCLTLLRAELQRLSAPVRVINPHDPSPAKFCLEGRAGLTGEIVTENSTIRLDDIRAVYLRPVGNSYPAELARLPLETSWLRRTTFHYAMSTWCDFAGALVINRPSSMASTLSREWQSETARRFGFSVPEPGSITAPTDCEHVEQIRYRAAAAGNTVRLDAPVHSASASIVSSRTRIAKHSTGIAYRVYVVGEQVFCCRLRDQDRPLPDLWDGAEPVDLPSHVRQRCLDLARELGLQFAALDLRLKSGGKWFCVEVDPCVDFSRFERATRTPIAATIAHLLVGATCSRAVRLSQLRAGGGYSPRVPRNSSEPA